MAGIFSRFIFNNAIFNTDGGITPVDTHDGGHWTERDYKRYRRKLELLARAGDKFNASKYIKEANKAVEIIQEIPIDAPVITQVAAREIEIDPAYFEAIQKELNAAIGYLDAIIQKQNQLRIDALQEQEDEQILLMSI